MRESVIGSRLMGWNLNLNEGIRQIDRRLTSVNLESEIVMSDFAETEEEEEEGFLGSIGFMFDAQHVRLTKTVCFGEHISLQLKLIGEDPGM